MDIPEGLRHTEARKRCLGPSADVASVALAGVGWGASLEGRLWLGPLIYKPGHRLEARTLTTTTRPMLGGPGRGLSPQWAQTPGPQCMEAATWEWGSGSVPIHPLLWVPGHGCSELWLGLSGGRVISHVRLFLWLQCHRYWTVATASSGE